MDVQSGHSIRWKPVHWWTDLSFVLHHCKIFTGSGAFAHTFPNAADHYCSETKVQLILGQALVAKQLTTTCPQLWQHSYYCRASACILSSRTMPAPGRDLCPSGMDPGFDPYHHQLWCDICCTSGTVQVIVTIRFKLDPDKHQLTWPKD